uniref:Transcription factor domain-containing protein n=1 Tax=Bionectria ochroleuca TaxID=29856 RepID=A0A8H7K7V7_BIOOC
MGKGFIFIDGTKSDRSTKRAARSHAMREKNIGKTHHRGLKPARGKNDLSTSQRNDGRRDIALSSHRFLDISDSILLCRPLPPLLSMEFAPWSLEVVKTYFTSVIMAVYPSKLCLSLDRIKSYWIRTIFLDQTSYHCSLALMSILNSFVFGREPVSWEATYHLGQAVALVNEKLDTLDALSNSNLAVVNFLVIRDIFKEDEAGAKIHLRGLQKMLELRGGLCTVEDRTLALKIAKTDIDFALHYGTPVGFFRDRMPQAAKELGMPTYSLVGGSSVFSTLCSAEASPDLWKIFQDVNGLACWFNNDVTCDADPDDLQEIIVSVGYRLVRFCSLGSPPTEANLNSAYHIGLVAFLTTLFLKTGGRRFLKYHLVARRLRDIVNRGQHESDKRPLLWLLFMGGISVLEESDQPWLLQRIKENTQLLAIESWTHMQCILCCFPWIHHLHTKPSRHLWELAVLI